MKDAEDYRDAILEAINILDETGKSPAQQEQQIKELKEGKEEFRSALAGETAQLVRAEQQIKELEDEANKQEKLAKHWYDKFFELRARTESKL